MDERSPQDVLNDMETAIKGLDYRLQGIYNKTDSILQTATHIPPLLTCIEAIEEKSRQKLSKRTLWLSGGLLIAFGIAGFFFGITYNVVARIASVPYAVSSETGCKAMGGGWQVYDNGSKFCFFSSK